jgi:uncharacterized protein
MRGRLLYFILTIFIGVFFLVNIFLGQKQTEFDQMAEQDAAVVEQFEKSFETRLKEKLEGSGGIQGLLGDEEGSIWGLALLIGLFTLSTIVGSFILMSYLIAKTRGKEWIRRIQIPPPTTWSIFDVLRVVILFLFFAYLINLFEVILVGLGWISGDGLARVLPIFNTIILDIWIAFCIICFAHFNQPSGAFRSLGIIKQSMGEPIVLGGMAYISILPIFFIVLTGVMWFSQWIGYEAPVHPLVTVFVAEESQITLFCSIFLGVAVGPIVEELFFRGFCYAALRKRWGIGPGILISSFLFSVVHWNPFSVLPIFCLGIALAYLYEKTGSLMASMTVHILHNGLLVIGLFLSRGVVGT